MELLHSSAVNKIKQNKTKLEKALNVKISFAGKNVSLEGSIIEEYIAARVIEALNLGFALEQALILKEEEFTLEKVNIKEITKRHDLKRIRARIIGTEGKTKKIMADLGNCFISLHENTIGVIGRAEEIKKVIQALISLVHGSKQSKVYSYLERERSREKTRINEDLGLKINKEKP